MSHTVSRRSVAKGAAWALPAIAVASSAPAMAVSGCEMKTITWTNGSAGPVDVNGSGATVRAEAKGVTKLRVNGGATGAGYDWPGNCRVYQRTLTTTPNFTNAVFFWMAGNNASGQEITITFGSEITCAAFYIADLDSGKDNGQYRDRIQTLTDGMTFSYGNDVSKSEVTIEGGTVAYQNTTVTPNKDTSNYDDRTDHGMVKVTYSGAPTRTLRVLYTNMLQPQGDGINSNSMQIALSGISYQEAGSGAHCPCEL